MPRNLVEYPVSGLVFTAVQTAGNSIMAVSPIKGRVKSVLINVDTVVDADLSWDILVNRVDSTTDVDLADEAVADAPHEMVVGATVSVEVGGAVVDVDPSGEFLWVDGTVAIGVVAGEPAVENARTHLGGDLR